MCSDGSRVWALVCRWMCHGRWVCQAPSELGFALGRNSPASKHRVASALSLELRVLPAQPFLGVFVKQERQKFRGKQPLYFFR